MDLIVFLVTDWSLEVFVWIHLIPKWRRPRMVWVEFHENEASRATEHIPWDIEMWE